MSLIILNENTSASSSAATAKTRRRRYLSRTVHGPVRQAQSYLNKVLRDRDLGGQVEGVTVTLDEFL